MIVDTIHLGGYSISDRVLGRNASVVFHCDFFIAVSSWESRCTAAIATGAFTGQYCVIVRFEDDEVTDSAHAALMASASAHFHEVEVVTLPSPRCGESLMSAVETLSKKVSDKRPMTCAVDYSSMPRVVTQLLYRKFLVDGFCPQVHWVYASGSYDETSVISGEIEQGAERFFSVRGALGNGGMATQSVAILALGADRGVVRAFMRSESYDIYHYIDATSSYSPSLSRKVLEQRDWLQREYGSGSESFHQCDAASVVATLRTYLGIVRSYPIDSGVSIEVFSSGPKAHAVAAASLLIVNSGIRLVARSPQRYNRIDVPSSGEILMTTVNDYTNPRLAQALVRSQ